MDVAYNMYWPLCQASRCTARWPPRHARPSLDYNFKCHNKKPSCR